MTWIVGTPVIWGYCFAVSDVRVTWGKEWRDCIQKIHQVGRYVALGFAGSVEIGFAMIEKMRTLLDCPDETRAWDPKAIAEWWPQDACDTFNGFPDSLKAHRCDLILLAVHPTELNGTNSVPYVYKFSSPDFIPRMASPYELITIGCGSDVQTYERLINTLSTDRGSQMKLLQAELGTPGGTGSRIGNRITDLLQNESNHGISTHLNYCWVEHGRITIITNNRSSSGRWTISPHGVDAPDVAVDLPGDGDYLVMPELAKTWNEFMAIARAEGLPSSFVAVA